MSKKCDFPTTTVRLFNRKITITQGNKKNHAIRKGSIDLLHFPEMTSIQIRQVQSPEQSSALSAEGYSGNRYSGKCYRVSQSSLVITFHSPNRVYFTDLCNIDDDGKDNHTNGCHFHFRQSHYSEKARELCGACAEAWMSRNNGRVRKAQLSSWKTGIYNI